MTNLFLALTEINYLFLLFLFDKDLSNLHNLIAEIKIELDTLSCSYVKSIVVEIVCYTIVQLGTDTYWCWNCTSRCDSG